MLLLLLQLLLPLLHAADDKDCLSAAMRPLGFNCSLQPYHARGLPVPLGQSHGSPDPVPTFTSSLATLPPSSSSPSVQRHNTAMLKLLKLKLLSPLKSPLLRTFTPNYSARHPIHAYCTPKCTCTAPECRNL